MILTSLPRNIGKGCKSISHHSKASATCCAEVRRACAWACAGVWAFDYPGCTEQKHCSPKPFLWGL